MSCQQLRLASASHHLPKRPHDHFTTDNVLSFYYHQRWSVIQPPPGMLSRSTTTPAEDSKVFVSPHQLRNRDFRYCPESYCRLRQGMSEPFHGEETKATKTDLLTRTSPIATHTLQTTQINHSLCFTKPSIKLESQKPNAPPSQAAAFDMRTTSRCHQLHYRSTSTHRRLDPRAPSKTHFAPPLVSTTSTLLFQSSGQRVGS